MLVFRDTIPVDFIEENSIVLDIETTGVSRVHSSVIVVGILESSGSFIQFAIEDTKDEKILLEEIFPYLHQKKLITFNGQNFDIPFLKSRYEHFGLNSFEEKDQFDIYRYLISNRLLTSIEYFSLQGIELYAELTRHENFENFEDVNFYKEFDSEELKKILLHNKYDVINTEKIIKVVNDIDRNKKFDIYFNGENYTISIENLNLDKNILSIEFSAPKLEIPYYFTNSEFELSWSENLTIKFGIIEGYVAQDILGYVHRSSKFIFEKGKYNLPENMICVFDGRYLLDNIKFLTTRILESCSK